ncbi:MAG TPA: hypothetical protein VFE58_03635 [Tepidisphaeraceae bacterium]|jgi:hypothetical protein|nr:hypothetical protein [Tepidisphaeraceae bacterium]
MTNLSEKGPKPVMLQSHGSGYVMRTARRMRRKITRENVLFVVQRLLWVAPLTLLIWIYAERQQERHQKVQFQVELVLNTPDRVILGPANRTITANLRGPAAQLETIKDQLWEKADDKPAVTIPIEPSLGPGAHDIQTSLILNDPIFRSHGISVDDTDPQTLNVYLDQIVEREVTVQAPPNVMNLDGKPVFDPPRVKVRGPRSELDQAGSDGMLDAFADLAGRESLKTPGVHEEKGVAVITQLRGEHVTVSPAKVNVTLKVRPADVTVVWPYMPVWVNMPPGFGDKYKVVLTNQTMKDVHLTGPAEIISAMQQESYRPKPKARLDVSNADLPAGETRVKGVAFDDLPKGVNVATEDATRTAEFKIVEAGRE